jgi:hypothetical protein
MLDKCKVVAKYFVGPTCNDQVLCEYCNVFFSDSMAHSLPSVAPLNTSEMRNMFSIDFVNMILHTALFLRLKNSVCNEHLC